MGKLEAMMQRQYEAQVYVHGNDVDSMSDEDRIEFITWNVLALTDELHEALGEIGWKPWATSRHINKDEFQGELIDAWHFMLNLFLVSGMSPDDIHRRYLEKRDRNDQRQEDGYDGVSTKCKGCGRALDDDDVKCYVETIDLSHDEKTVRSITTHWCAEEQDWL